MDSCICFLGQSQTFMGVLATIIVLSIRRNDSNFVFHILDNIKRYIVTRVKEIKPEISYDKLKDGSAYKAILLYSKTREDGNETLIEQCKQRCVLVTLKELEAQKKLTSWDKDTERFADDIYKKQEQQMAPMFSFAYCIIVFLFDEIIRCSNYYVSANLSFGFNLFSVMICVFWMSKWIVFLINSQDSNLTNNQKTDTNKQSLWKRTKAVNGIIKTTVCILLEIIILVIIQKSLISYPNACFCVTIIFLVSLSFVYTRISAGGRKEKSDGGVCLHYICQFFMMFTITVICIVEVILLGIDSPILYTFCSANFLFYSKILSFAIVLCFGLIFPFLFPLIKYVCIYIKAYCKIQKYKLNIIIDTISLNNDFEKLSRTINIH